MRVRPRSFVRMQLVPSRWGEDDQSAGKGADLRGAWALSTTSTPTLWYPFVAVVKLLPQTGVLNVADEHFQSGVDSSVKVTRALQYSTTESQGRSMPWQPGGFFSLITCQVIK